MFPMNKEPIVTTVEHTDVNGDRVTREFKSAAAARKFFVKMVEEGADPKVVKAQLPGNPNVGPAR